MGVEQRRLLTFSGGRKKNWWCFKCDTVVVLTVFAFQFIIYGFGSFFFFFVNFLYSCVCFCV